ncbi:bifunctional 2',3'-cyclic-nucleotide 2'-phosphodiesterase/3'-nucleotidase [Natronincola peptidivorans]|nr:bifunctional 2',3'-cyclic-nucleotide 2'-phosphodiesterase/3'-nucleotidase [Natronincola peptidivorans]
MKYTGKALNNRLISTILTLLLIVSSFSFAFGVTESDTTASTVVDIDLTANNDIVALDNKGNGTHELVIMGTTDIHVNLMPYDYMTDRVNENHGMSKVATLIDQIRAQHKNTLLLDAGDMIQGSLLGNIEAVVDPLKDGEVHVSINSMNMMGYDAAILGNHEFNFGLDFLERAYSGANFPVVNANVYEVDTDENYFTPYVILDREIDGEAIKIGVIGFTPPQIMIWDKIHLDGKVYTKEIVETAEKFVPEMREAGADLIIAVAHTGIDANEGASENAAYFLSQVEGIDAMVLGHQHKRFPSTDYENIPGIDIEKGTINGVPTIMAGSWGNNLGTIALNLTYGNGVWTILDSKSELTATANLSPRQDIVDSVAAKHQQTIEYVNTPVGETYANLNTFFSRVMDNKVIQLVNDAQLWFADGFFDGTEYEGIPVLSAAAPFKAGRHGPDYYTNVEAGGIAVKDVADIYIYDNTLQIVKVDTATLIGWLEKSAENFNQINPTKTDDQVLLDYNYRGFNFDHIAGIEYQIDVTKPAGKRIVNVTFEGKPLAAGMEFLVVTNNYRASGGGDHLLNSNSEVVYSGTEENREVIIDYITKVGAADPQVTNYWSILPVETAGRVIFRGSSIGQDSMDDFEAEKVAYIGEEDGWSLYAYNLSLGAEEAAIIIEEPVVEESVVEETIVEEPVVVEEPVEVIEAPTTIYIVQTGDWLSTIAMKYGTTWEELQEMNEIKNPNLIFPGQKIIVPAQ